MIYDEEDVIKDIEQVFLDNLDAEIAIVNSEKNDALVLETIPADKYIFETVDKKVLNFKGFFVLFGLLPNDVAEENSNNFQVNTKITFQIGTFDSGPRNRREILYKLLRYRKALIRVVMKNPDMFRGYAKPLVKSLKPDALPLDNTNVILKCGVDITASVTGN